jgi:hypothetical protein
MKIVNLSVNDQRRVGLLDGDHVIDILAVH